MMSIMYRMKSGNIMKSDTSQAKPQAQVDIFTVHKVTLIEAIYTHKI